MDVRRLETRCCIAGGGPAGIMLGYLLARSGIDVVVLEKWPDFLRDFRGDTIHPSTMTVLRELGLLEKFLQLPHDEVARIGGRVGDEEVMLADFSKTRMRTPFIAFIPQWDFLTFIAGAARAYPSFRLLMHTEAVGLIEGSDRVVGLEARDEEGPLEIRAELVVGADGRHSTVRQKAGFPVHDLGAPMDVLWFRVPRRPDDPAQVLGTIDAGQIMIMIERGTYWQCGFVIPKGDLDGIKARGIGPFRDHVRRLAPFLGERVGEIRSWEEVKFLGVTVDRLEEWARPGLLCIGDAAHAMSPIGGIGINIAVQDAVAAANILVPAFRRGIPALADLRKVQRRRMFAVRATQFVQLLLQKQLIARILGGTTRPRIPFIFRMLRSAPFLRALPAYFIGIGVRPEHVRIR
jgi:2-polyprenyl-6-methoxyphenol hydroxylase-like FAD-dependent oxidoreductase